MRIKQLPPRVSSRFVEWYEAELRAALEGEIESQLGLLRNRSGNDSLQPASLSEKRRLPDSNRSINPETPSPPKTGDLQGEDGSRCLATEAGARCILPHDHAGGHLWEDAAIFLSTARRP